MLRYLIAAAIALTPVVAFAAPGTLQDCSGTATNASTSITFAHRPQVYLYIGNPQAVNTIWINPTGAAAAASTAGSMLIAPGLAIAFDRAVQPGAVKVISPSGNTPYTCWYQ